MIDDFRNIKIHLYEERLKLDFFCTEEILFKKNTISNKSAYKKNNASVTKRIIKK